MIAGTIELEAALARIWDAIVIGAGPAGALAARQAALAGSQVLLVDAKSFPREKVCGACLNGGALAVLESVGLGDLPCSLGGRPLERFNLRSDGRQATLGLPSGVAVSRGRFDAALVSAAIAAGAQFLPATFASVDGLSAAGPDECRQVSLKRCESKPVVAAARIVLCADGLGHASLRERDEFASRVAARGRIGLGGQLHDFPADYVPGTIFMAVGPHGYVGLVRVETDPLNIAAALAPEFVKESGGPPAALAAVLQQAGFPAIAAIHDTDWHGTIELTRRSARVAGRRVLLLGDAAGYVEPFTGEGMAWALSAAAAVTPSVRRATGEWDGRIEDEWTSLLRQIVLKRQRWCRRLAWALRHPLAVRMILTALALVPALAAPVVRDLNRAR